MGTSNSYVAEISNTSIQCTGVESVAAALYMYHATHSRYPMRQPQLLANPKKTNNARLAHVVYSS